MLVLFWKKKKGKKVFSASMKPIFYGQSSHREAMLDFLLLDKQGPLYVIMDLPIGKCGPINNVGHITESQVGPRTHLSVNDRKLGTEQTCYVRTEKIWNHMKLKYFPFLVLYKSFHFNQREKNEVRNKYFAFYKLESYHQSPSGINLTDKCFIIASTNEAFHLKYIDITIIMGLQ